MHTAQSEIRFTDAASHFLDWCEGEFRSHPNTWKRKRVSFKSLTQFFETCLVPEIEQRPGMLEQFKLERRKHVRDVTIRHDLHALSSFFQFCVLNGWAQTNPVRRIRIPSDRDAVRANVISAADEQAYFDVARRNREFHAFARLILLTGMRPSEVLALRIEDYDAEHHQVRIRQGKTKAAQRSLRLNAEAEQLIGELARRAAKQNLFAARSGAARETPFNKCHDRACLKAKVRFCLYDLRHTFATRAAERGMPVPVLAAILGHSNLRCVMRYVHPQQHAMDEAMLKFAAG